MRRRCPCLYASGAVLFHSLIMLASGLVSSKVAEAAATSQEADLPFEAKTKPRCGNRKAPAACPRRTVKKSAVRPLAVNAKLATRHGGPLGDAVNTWLIFGFTEGSDVGNKGEWSFFHDSIIRAAGQTSGFAAWDGATGAGYSLTNRTVIGAAVTSSFQRYAAPSNMMGEIRSSESHSVGALASLKYQVFRRDESPAGLAIQISPYWQQSKSSPIGHDTIGTEFRLIADRTLVAERWFAAANLVYLPQHNAYADGSVVRESTLEISGAVSHRLWGDLFVGGEVRHLAKFQGYSIERFAGRALYLGPTLFTAVGEQGYFGVAWSMQVAGSARITAAPQLDLESFERHQFRLKGGLSF
jgi:hypothetical protein